MLQEHKFMLPHVVLFYARSCFSWWTAATGAPKVASPIWTQRRSNIKAPDFVIKSCCWLYALQQICLHCDLGIDLGVFLSLFLPQKERISLGPWQTIKTHQKKMIMWAPNHTERHNNSLVSHFKHMSFSLPLSISLPLYLGLSLSLSVSVPVCLSHPPCLSLSVSLTLCVYPCLSLWLGLSVWLFLCLYWSKLSLSLSPSTCIAHSCRYL